MAGNEDADALKPGMSLLCKLGSAVVHAEELAGPGGHEFDAAALKQLLADPEVTGWMASMRSLAHLPEKRA